MIDKDCTTCKFEEGFTLPCFDCYGDTWHWELKKVIVETSDSITFPILNNLTPTVHSCTLKMIEEIGELCQLIGKEQRKSGEELCYAGRKRYWAIATISEALDTAQASVTMAHTLCKEHDIDMDAMMEAHRYKLKQRGYLK